MTKRNWKRRADGKRRTVKPTKAGLRLLRKVRKLFDDPARWVDGSLVQEEIWDDKSGEMVELDQPAYCIMGAIGALGGCPYEALDDLFTEEMVTPRIANATTLLVETVNGDPLLIDDYDDIEYINPNAAVMVNDNDRGYEAILSALDRTIRYAESELDL